LYSNKPREEWAIDKAQRNFVQTQETGSTTIATTTSTESSQNSESTRTSNGCAGTHLQYGFAQADVMKKWILLDNQSSVTVFLNKDLVSNIQPTEDTLNLHTNGGVLTTYMKCDIPHWGEAWFASNGITNIFSYVEMAKKYKITSDSSIDNALQYTYQIDLKSWIMDSMYLFQSNTETVNFYQALKKIKIYTLPINLKGLKKPEMYTMPLGHLVLMISKPYYA
jgi:hypothetical protein